MGTTTNICAKAGTDCTKYKSTGRTSVYNVKYEWFIFSNPPHESQGLISDDFAKWYTQLLLLANLVNAATY